MYVFFVENDDSSNLFKKILKKIEIEEDVIKINSKIEKDKQRINISKKIKNILDLNNSNKIILSKSLKSDEKFVDMLYSQNIDIVKGKYLFKVLLEKIFDKILIENNLKSQDTKIAICVNYADYEIIKIIEGISKKFKAVNIVTNNVAHFKNLEKNIYEESGIILTVTNNKKKALNYSQIILNIDFTEESVNKYRIYDNSIIITLEDDIKINKKRFTGKVVSNFNIVLKKDSNIEKELDKIKYQKYDMKDLAEIYLMKNPKEVENIDVY